MFFTLLIATLDFTASDYCHTCYRHSLHSFILRQSSPVIVWACLAPFYWYNYTHQLGRIITSQRLYTLFRPISHVASSPRHLSHSPNLRFHIYHHSLVCFACLSAEPLGLSHCSRFSHVAVTLVALRSVFGFCCCALHWSGDCQHISDNNNNKCWGTIEYEKRAQTSQCSCKVPFQTGARITKKPVLDRAAEWAYALNLWLKFNIYFRIGSKLQIGKY